MEGTRLLLLLVMASCGAFIAKKRKLNPFFWFAICFSLGISALVVLLFLPKIQKILRRKKKVNTPETPAATPEFLPNPAFSKQSLWYYLDNQGTQKGPVSFQRLQEIRISGEIYDQTYIWNEELEYWKKWEEIFPSRRQEGTET